MARTILFLSVLLLAAGAPAEVALPALTARVTDLSNTLTAGQKAALEQKLAAFEQRKGSQVAVLMVPTTQPEAIEQFSIRVVEAWKLGRKGVDDGAMLIVAKDDRKLRIEVGYGLEGALTDAISSRIINETIRPAFRSGDFFGGINAGVDQIIAVIDGEPLPEPRRQPGRGVSSIGQLLPVLFILVFVVSTFLKRIFGQLPGALLIGGAAAFLTWLLLGVLTVSALAGIAGFVLALLNAAAPGRWSNRGTYLGGLGGGGFGGGGLGGGGFGGGGGGFGGGGASGGW